jgi:type IX secretion system PorP/SprF family membrane protein
MKIYIALLLLMLLSGAVCAQQDPLYAQYINNPFVLNPAYAGLTENLSLALSYRNQWSNLDGSPKTWNAGGHISLHNNKMGAGLMVINDQAGSRGVTEIMVSYSYRLPLSNDKTLSFGLQGGFANYKIDNSKVNPYDPTDPLFEGQTSETRPTIGFGAILKNDRYYISFSIPRLLKSDAQAQDLSYSVYSRHYYLMGSYLVLLSDRIRFKPSALLKMVSGAPMSIDLNTSLIFLERYQAGILTRNFNTYGLFVQALVKDNFRLGYVFEVPTGSSVGSSFQTHEITLGYRLNALAFHHNTGVFSF